MSCIKSERFNACTQRVSQWSDAMAQKASESPKLWGFIGIALLAIAITSLGLFVWGVTHFFTHIWGGLGSVTKFITLYAGGLMGSIIWVPALVLFVGVPAHFGGKILHKAIHYDKPTVPDGTIKDENL